MIKNRATGRPVGSRQNRQGFVMANLMTEDGRKVTRSVALLVADAYLNAPRNENYNSVIHLDGDKGNCEATNLMWRPRWYAVRYHRMFSEDVIPVSVYIEETREEFGTLRDLCMKYGLEEKYTYLDMRNGHRCFHYNYRIRELK